MPNASTSDVLVLVAGALARPAAHGRRLLVARLPQRTCTTSWAGHHAPPAAFRDKARYVDAVQFRDAGGGEGAEGVRDVMPETPEGYAELWGRGILHCLFCHGFEERGAASAGVLGTGPMLGGADSDSAPLMAPVIARMAARLAGRVTVYADENENLGSRIRAQLKSSQKFDVDNRRIVRLAKDSDVEGDAGMLVTLEDGSVNKEGFLESMLQAIVRRLMKAVPMATMMGSSVAAGLAHALQAEDGVEE
ncbi:FAD/NAD(P)-binding domain-containing protein [Annulohypoxylon truncatum]|uniref:FAD/NAD(P)-binding domain-containing protein n=1 Tax=Annulohypoxylon truncatum TaxID=327061 RepID=UPI002007B1BB|nr:FAD/NAD(P)-binding domain-containing protein [Annulohypoxylon truncatum]KAI1209533.1 FAD/NAD(P)-binding domain-containing protein [Annulohypoxylon truncatum]